MQAKQNPCGICYPRKIVGYGGGGGDHQQRAFENIKHELSAQPVMALYDPHSETVVSADASTYGLGAVLIQRQRDGNCRPVAYASRAMTNTEQMYAEIEKEALALTWLARDSVAT